MKYTIELRYVANFVTTVEGDFKDEGEALDAARTNAEEADMQDFTLTKGLEAQIINAS